MPEGDGVIEVGNGIMEGAVPIETTREMKDTSNSVTIILDCKHILFYYLICILSDYIVELVARTSNGIWWTVSGSIKKQH